MMKFATFLGVSGLLLIVQAAPPPSTGEAMFCHVCVDAVDNNDCNATSVCDDEHSYCLTEVLFDDGVLTIQKRCARKQVCYNMMENNAEGCEHPDERVEGLCSYCCSSRGCNARLPPYEVLESQDIPGAVPHPPPGEVRTTRPRTQEHTPKPAHEHATKPIPQEHTPKPRTQEHTTKPRTQEHTTEPRSQEHTTEPRTQEHTTEPRTQEHTTKPRTQEHTTKPRTQEHTPKPRTQEHTPKPRTQEHTPKPKTQEHTPKPKTQEHTTKPRTQEHTPKPKTQEHTPKPKTQEHTTEPRTQEHTPRSTTQEDTTHSFSQQHVSQMGVTSPSKPILHGEIASTSPPTTAPEKVPLPQVHVDVHVQIDIGKQGQGQTTSWQSQVTPTTEKPWSSSKAGFLDTLQTTTPDPKSSTSRPSTRATSVTSRTSKVMYAQPTAAPHAIPTPAPPLLSFPSSPMTSPSFSPTTHITASSSQGTNEATAQPTAAPTPAGHVANCCCPGGQAKVGMVDSSPLQGNPVGIASDILKLLLPGSTLDLHIHVGGGLSVKNEDEGGNPVVHDYTVQDKQTLPVEAA